MAQIHRLSRLAAFGLSVVSLLSCGSEPSAPSASARQVPAPAISDGAHEGNPHFYFLQPMVPSPAFSGTADANASPTVVVCEWNENQPGGACGNIIASFSRAGGTGSEAIGFDGEKYQVNWHTDQCLSGPCALDPARSYRLRVLIGATELGHADVRIGVSGKELKNVSTNEFIPLLNGRTLPVKFRIEHGAVQVVAPGAAASVGAAGGEITKNDGTVSLKFPMGALAAATDITMEVVTDPLPGVGEWAAPVALGPDGSTFAVPVRLTMAYDASKLPEGVTPHALKLATWVNDHWEEVPGSRVDLSNATVSGDLTHFSTYGLVIWPNAVEGHPTTGTLFVGQQTTIQGSVWEWVTQPGTWCWYERTWIALSPSGYWNWEFVCRSYTSTWSHPASGIGVSFTSNNPSVASVAAPGAGTTGGTGSAGLVTSPLITAVSAGSAIITAEVSGVSVTTTLTVLGSLSFDVFGSGPVSLRRFGFNQGTGMNVKIPAALPNALTVTFTHSNPAVAGSNSSLVIPAGATQNGLTIGAGTVAGRDTLIGTAPGFGPDTLIIETGPGHIFVTGWPTTLSLGDSAAIRVRPMNPDSTIIDNAWFTTFALSSNGKLAFALASAPITSVGVPDGSSSTPVFWVKAIQPGAAVMNVTNQHYVTGPYPVTVTMPPGPRLVFTSNRTGDAELWSTDASGGLALRLTASPGTDDEVSVSPDGQRVAFRSFRSGSADVFVMNQDGSGLANLTNNGVWDAEPAWSPNGHKIAFNSNRSGDDEIWVMNADGSSPVQLTAIPGGDGQPDWSPDGTRIVWTSSAAGNFEIYSMRADGTHKVRLTNHPGIDFHPAWSPDGRRIAFMRDNNLFVMNGDGSNVVQRTFDGASNGRPDWSADGTRIAFESARDGLLGIYTVAPDGSGLTRISSLTHTESHPSWVGPFAILQEDPQLVVFGTSRDPANQGEIYTMKPDGSMQLIVHSHPAQDEQPDLSYDRTRIAFVSNRNGNRNIFTINVNGSGLTQVTNQDGFLSGARWSPDGTRLLFNSDFARTLHEVYAINADGTGLVRLTNNSGQDGAASWSPDGSRIVFSSDRSGSVQIWVMNADGSSPVQLTNASGFHTTPAFSPDGTRIVYNVGSEIWVMHADGSSPTRVTTGFNDQGPTWSPDGTKILFASNRAPGRVQVFSMNANGTGITQLTFSTTGDNGGAVWR